MYEVNVILTCFVITMLYDYRKSPTEKLRAKFHRRNRSYVHEDVKIAVKSTKPAKSVKSTKRVNPVNPTKPVNYAPRKRRRYRKSALERFLLSCRPRKHKYQARSSRRINGKFQYKYW